MIVGSAILSVALGTVIAQPPAGSIVGWGSQVVGVDLTGPFTHVAAGGFHSLGLKSDGSIVAWGYNGSDQTNVPAPNAGFVAIASRGFHSLGLKADGSVLAWGDNHDGECNVSSPNSDFVAIAAGGGISLGIRGSKADYNDDGFTDASDDAELWNVLDSDGASGPSVEPTVRFWFLFDMDDDGDVDLADVARFANAFTGQ